MLGGYNQEHRLYPLVTFLRHNMMPRSKKGQFLVASYVMQPKRSILKSNPRSQIQPAQPAWNTARNCATRIGSSRWHRRCNHDGIA